MNLDLFQQTIVILDLILFAVFCFMFVKIIVLIIKEKIQ
jgi:hypothetical protein